MEDTKKIILTEKDKKAVDDMASRLAEILSEVIIDDREKTQKISDPGALNKAA